jgi:hypothetical protein
MPDMLVPQSLKRPLTVAEAGRLAELEARIESAGGVAQWITVGLAIDEIRRDKLYRASGTFEQYVRQRWGISRVHAFRLGRAAKVGLLMDRQNGSSPSERSLRSRLTGLAADKLALMTADERKAYIERREAQAIRSEEAERERHDLAQRRARGLRRLKQARTDLAALEDHPAWQAVIDLLDQALELARSI